MKLFQNKLVILLILPLLLLGGGFIYYWHSNTAWNTKELQTGQNAGEKSPARIQGLFYQFDYDPTQRAKINIFTYDFLNGEKVPISTFDSFLAPDIFSKNNIIAYTKTLNDSNCVKGFLGQLKCQNELRLLKLSDRQEISVATNVITFAFSSSADYLFYVIYNKEEKESKIYRFSVSKGINDILLDNWKGIIELILGSSKDGSVIFTQRGKLYSAINKEVNLLHDSKIETKEELFTHYDLSIDGSKVLVVLGTRFGETAMGLYDLATETYQDLNLKSWKTDGDYSFALAKDGKSILINTGEGYGQYSYSTFDLINKERKIIFETDKGLIIESIPGENNFLIRKEEFINHRGVVSFFIEPFLGQNKLVVQNIKADGNGPNIYFLDWR